MIHRGLVTVTWLSDQAGKRDAIRQVKLVQAYVIVPELPGRDTREFRLWGDSFK